MNDDLMRCVSEALRTSSADTDDCPNLFLRVAAGVERRRRRHRATAGAIVAVAVGVALAVPTLSQVGAGSTHTTISAEASARPVDGCTSDQDLPSNAFVRRAEALDGTTCSSATVDEPTPVRWLHEERRNGLTQP
jgi:hypothetical protein